MYIDYRAIHRYLSHKTKKKKLAQYLQEIKAASTLLTHVYRVTSYIDNR